MTQAADAHASTRDALYRPLWRVFLLSLFTIHIYDYIWYSNIAKHDGSRVKSILPVWPYQIGAILVAYTFSYYVFLAILPHLEILSEHKKPAYDLLLYITTLSYGSRPAFRTYKTVAAFRLISAYRHKIGFKHIVMTLLLPVTYSQHIINKSVNHL